MSPLTLNYQGLLGLPSPQAFTQAMAQATGIDLAYWEGYYGVSIGVPAQDPSQPTDLTATLVPVAYSDPTQDPDNEPLSYRRLVLGDYLACCQRFLTPTDAASPTALSAWLAATHGLYFAPTDLVLGTVVVDPALPDRLDLTVTVAPGNYVWTGAATLFIVTPNHLARLAYPGVAKGLIWSDVLTA